MQHQARQIAIIGAGNVGTALGTGWAKAGHRISYGIRSPQGEKAQQLQAAQPDARVASNADAVREAQVVALCTPWSATEAAIRDCGDLTGKIIIDATNPLKPDLSGLDRGLDTSGGEQVAAWARGAQVFKAMNQIGYGLMDHPQFPSGLQPVMFVAGDGEGKPAVLRLIADLGFEAIDAGALTASRLLEPYALLWIHLAIFKGLGPNFGFGLLRR